MLTHVKKIDPPKKFRPTQNIFNPRNPRKNLTHATHVTHVTTQYAI